jgi:hypothetical protein
MLRSESKISSEHIVELADEQGIPLMFGWMCCNQWEKWDQWSEKDHRVASESLRSQITHAASSCFRISSGPTEAMAVPPIRFATNTTGLSPSCTGKMRLVDTVSSFAKDAKGEHLWDGVHYGRAVQLAVAGVLVQRQVPHRRADLAPSRETTSTFQPWRAEEVHSRRQALADQ